MTLMQRRRALLSRIPVKIPNNYIVKDGVINPLYGWSKEYLNRGDGWKYLQNDTTDGTLKISFSTIASRYLTASYTIRIDDLPGNYLHVRSRGTTTDSTWAGQIIAKTAVKNTVLSSAYGKDRIELRVSDDYQIVSKLVPSAYIFFAICVQTYGTATVDSISQEITDIWFDNEGMT